jgi:hypothetical protein
MADNDIKSVVARKLRGLPADIDEPQIHRSEDGGVACIDCGVNPVAEKGTQAHAHGLCSNCASWKRRHGEWRDVPLG